MHTRTRPDVKWLINEVAMLAGELRRIDKEAARLAEHRVKVEQAHRACLQTLAVVTEALPLRLPTVQQHRPYGGRGALRRLLLDALREVQPKALDTNQLTQLVVQCLGVTFPSPEALAQYRKGTVGRTLRFFLQQGVIERIDIPAPGPTNVGYWRWKAEIPTIDALANDSELAARRTVE